MKCQDVCECVSLPHGENLVVIQGCQDVDRQLWSECLSQKCARAKDGFTWLVRFLGNEGNQILFSTCSRTEQFSQSLGW